MIKTLNKLECLEQIRTSSPHKGATANIIINDQEQDKDIHSHHFVFLRLYFFGCIGSSLWRVGFSLVVACRFSLSSCGARAPGHMGSVVCGTWALSLRCVSSVVVACGLSCPTRDRTGIPCTGRQILYHWTTREVPLTTSIQNYIGCFIQGN